MTLPSTAYRGHAAPTWDTKTIQSMIDYLTSTFSVPVLDARYGAALAPSASAYFLDAQLPGATNAQVLPYATPVAINCNSVLTNNGGFSFAGNGAYTVPAAGVYLCMGVVRLNDSAVTNANGSNLGLGIHNSNDVAETSFQWNKIPPTNVGAARCAISYSRMATFSGGSQLRLYGFWDSATGSGSLGLYSARLSIWRIG